MAYYNPNISFKEIFSDREILKHSNIACFSGMSGRYNGEVEAAIIKYSQIVNKSLDIGQITFYIEFLKQILDLDCFKYKIRQTKKFIFILWELKCKNWAWHKTLLYL